MEDSYCKSRCNKRCCIFRLTNRIHALWVRPLIDCKQLCSWSQNIFDNLTPYIKTYSYVRGRESKKAYITVPIAQYPIMIYVSSSGYVNRFTCTQSRLLHCYKHTVNSPPYHHHIPSSADTHEEPDNANFGNLFATTSLRFFLYLL